MPKRKKRKLIEQIEVQHDPPISSDLWETRYEELCQFHKEFGHTNLPAKYPANQPLSYWVTAQRRRLKNYHFQRKDKKFAPLSKRQIELLEQIEFQYDRNHDIWETRYRELCEFHKEFGHPNVPYKYPANKKLGHWVNTQRLRLKNYHFQRKNNTSAPLSKRQIELLEQIGFAKRDSWNTRYGELCEFHKQFGHTNIPRKYDLNPPLGYWVNKQRHRLKNYHLQRKGTTTDSPLSKRQVELLEQIGFQHDPFRDMWDTRYIELCEYQKEYGNTRVPQDFVKNKQLALWVMTQRRRLRNYKLQKDDKTYSPLSIRQTILLEKINFT